MPAVPSLVAPADTDDYISAAQALRRWPRLNRPALYRLAMAKEVRVRLPRGRSPIYCVADIARLMAGREG